MKCPGCSSITSDLRDICPKCLIDLRPHKLQTGIKVSSPEASYEDLVSKVQGTSKQDDGINSFLGSLKNFLTFSTEDKKPAPPSPPPVVEQKIAEAVSAATTIAEVPKDSLHTPEIQEQPEAAPPPTQDLAPTEATQTYIEPTPPPVSSPEDLSPDIQQKTEIPQDAEINTLFKLAANDAIAASALVSELSAGHFQQIQKRQDIDLLFDIAFEAIHDLSAESSLNIDYEKSEGKQLESTFVAAQLEKVERIFSDSVRMLRNVGRSGNAKPKSEAYQLKGPKPLIDPDKMVWPSKSERFALFAIDWFFVGIIGIIIGSLYTNFFTSDFPGIFHPGEMRDLDVFALFINGIITSFIFAPAYFVSAQTLYDTTVGAKLLGLVVLSDTGRDAKGSNALVRGLLIPLSTLCFGYLTLLKKNQSAHDLLARTVLCKNTSSTGKILTVKIGDSN